MKITTLRRLLTVVLCLALAVGAISMTACGKKSPTLLELDGNKITANQYQFLLSRVKGSLHYTGYIAAISHTSRRSMIPTRSTGR